MASKNIRCSRGSSGVNWGVVAVVGGVTRSFTVNLIVLKKN